MSIATVANTIASQQEYMRTDLPMLYMASARLWKYIEVRTDVKPISNRPARIPFEVLAGGKFRQGQFDGGDMGLGSGIQETFGNLSCASFLFAWQYTALAEWSTNSDQKAIENYVTLTNKRAAKGFAAYMDAIVQGDGSNTLDTVVSTGTNQIVVNNANAFQDNQDVDVWSALSGTFRGTVTVLSVDIANNTIWLTGPIPAGTTANDLLLVSGSAGVASSGLFGLLYYLVSGNAGNYMGIQRSAFPGKFSTPTISVNGSLVPASVRALEGQIELAMSIEEADAVDLRPHCNVDMRAAWENNAILVQRVIQNEVKGDESVDMLKKRAPTVMAGRELLVNERAKPGVINFLALKNWWRIETKPMDYYEVGGQTIFPSYGLSGGIATSMLFYLVTMCQVGCSQPRLNAFMNNITIPKGYFGH